MLLKNATILVIDDDVDVLTAVRLLLKTEAKEVVTEKNPENLRWLLSKQSFDVILLDMNFNSSINTGNEGLYWLKKVKEFKSEAAVIMITAYGDIDRKTHHYYKRCFKKKGRQSQLTAITQQ
jgi:two-component system, NtrC family, response regulator HydG